MSDVAVTPIPWELPDRGKVGVVCLIITEAALFTIFVVAYVFYVGKSITGPFPNEVLELPILSTICLLSSSLTVTIAERGLRRGSRETFHLWLAATILLGGIFLAGTAMEWKKLIVHDHLTIATNLFGTTFYSLVGLHASHVVIGLTLLSIVLVASLRSDVMLHNERRFVLLAWYWHFVDVVWVIVFTVVYVYGR